VRRLVGAAALMAVVLVLGGCDGSSDTPASGNSAVGDDGVGEPAATAGLPSGIVYAKDDFSSMTKVVTVYDINTGEALGSAVAPYQDLSREVFDSTMNQLVYATKCELHLATLANGVYTSTVQWKPAQAYGQGEQCFDQPAFRDSRIRVTIGTSGSDSYKLASVDPAHPQTPPKDEGAGSPRQEKRYTIAGKSESDVRVHTEDGVITSAWVTGSMPQREGEYYGASYSYQCNVRVDDTTFVCSSSEGEGRQPFGSVATATLNSAASSVTITQVAPASKTANATVLVAPDHKRVAIHDSTGWYTTTLGSSSAPVRQPLSELKDLGDPLFWN
jgi:hypothetical protein